VNELNGETSVFAKDTPPFIGSLLISFSIHAVSNAYVPYQLEAKI